MKSLTGQTKSLIGMVHVAALPGTPRNTLSMKDIVARAVEEAWCLRENGFDALLIENMHDLPYLKREVGPEIVAAMTRVAAAVRESIEDCPLGIQVLAGANKAALATAQAAGAQFIRAEGLVFAHVADEGIIESDAGELLRYRRTIGAEKIRIFADIKKKHSSHAITADVSLADTAHAAEFFGADGLIITGTATGAPTSPADLRETRQATLLPVWVGSGTTPENLAAQWPFADAFVVGSYIKKDGQWNLPLDVKRIRAIVAAANALRSGPSGGTALSADEKTRPGTLRKSLGARNKAT